MKWQDIADDREGAGAAAAAPGQLPGPASRPGWWRTALTGWVLRAATAAALIVDAVVHLQDAHFYDVGNGALLSEGGLFRIQSVAAIVVALAVAVWPRWPVWVLSFLVTASAVAAVVAYTYVDIGAVAGLPNMYEPSWGPPGKLASAIAEGAGAVLSRAGLSGALSRRRRRP